MNFVVARCVCLAGLYLLVTNFAQAMDPEDTQKAVRGLSEIQLLIVGLDPEAKKCGITPSLIRDAFMFPVSSSRLNIVDRTSGPAFYIRVNTIFSQSHRCITSMEAAVINYQPVKLDYKDDEPSRVELTLWSDRWVSFSSPSRHPQQVQQAVETSTKKFVTIWNNANKDFPTNPSGH
jgi:hypothetical protein